MIVSWTKRGLILLFAMIMMAGVACGEGVTGVDFSNGNFDFLAAYPTPPDADPVELSLVEVDGANAVRVALTQGGTPYVLIDAGSLLGDALGDLREMRVTVGVENPDGVFHAVSGEIVAYDGLTEAGLSGAWSVYLETKNPNVARIAVDGRPADLFVLSKKVDNAFEEGHAPSNLIIHGIAFLGADGEALPVNPDAVFVPPDGFGQADRAGLLPVSGEVTLDGAQGSSSGWGQAVALTTLKNDGPLDPALLAPGCVVSVYYASATPPELILQSWTEGAPAEAGWAKVAPSAVNDSATIAQFRYDDLTAAFGGDSLAEHLDQLYVGDTGESLSVSAVTIGQGE